MKKRIRNGKIGGFTLIEILVVIGIIAILAAVVIIAINPGRQFAQSRNTQRWSNVNTILNAVGQNMADNDGTFTCAAGDIPTTATELGSGVGNYNIEPCIVPTYVSIMVFDPSGGTAAASGYEIQRDATTERITVSAPNAELTETIAVTR